MTEERNRVLAPEERENRPKDSANAKPKPTTGHAQDVRQYPRAPSESSLQRMDSSYRSCGYGSNATYLPDTNDSRQKVGLSSGHSSEERDEPVPVQPVPERDTGDNQDRDDDVSPLLVRLGQPPPRTSSSGDWFSSAVEQDEQTHPPPSAERDQTKQSMQSIPLPSNTMHVEVTAVGYVIVITKQSTSHN